MKERIQRKNRVGVVVSTKMKKTISVEVSRLVRHPLYKKYFKRTSVFKAHDEKQECGVGDKVRIIETRPISRTKCWRLVEVIEKAGEKIELLPDVEGSEATKKKEKKSVISSEVSKL